MDVFTVLVVLAPMVAAATLLAVFFLPAFPLLTVPGLPEDLYRPLVQRLRLAGFVVSEGDGQMSVRVGRISAVRVHLRSVTEGTEIRYRPDATPSGWTLVLALIFLGAYGLTAIAAVILVLYVALRASQFTRLRLANLAVKAAMDPRPRPDASLLLVDELAETYRIATEAYEAERSAHGDRVLLAALGALALWTVLFFGISLRATTAWEVFAVPTVAAAVVLAVGGLAVWRSFRPRRAEYRAWADRLKEAWTRASESPAGADGMAVLAEASTRVPDWLHAARRAGFLRDPHGYVVPVALGFWGYWLLWASVWFAPQEESLSLAAVLGAAGVGLLAAGVLFQRRWVRAQESDAQRSAEDWTRRLEAIRSRAERRAHRP